MALIIGLTVGAGFLVATTLRAPEIQSYPPTVPAPEEVGARRVGPVLVTVDASDGDEWIYFDFSRGSVVESPTARGWDLAFQRHRIIVNGGPGFVGEGGVRPLPSTSLDSVDTVPDTAYVVNQGERDSTNPALERWYDYSWTSHVLEPKPVVYAVRTADGRFAKLQILGYYCPGARPGCLTLRYVYQGDGGVDVRAP